MNRERRNKQIEKHPLHGNKTKMNEKDIKTKTYQRMKTMRN